VAALTDGERHLALPHESGLPTISMMFSFSRRPSIGRWLTNLQEKRPYPTKARTRTALSLAFLFFAGATIMSEPVSGSAFSPADPSTT
jgi:hypothetical protein